MPNLSRPPKRTSENTLSTAASLLKLVAVEVDDLFGIYKHHIPFKTEEGVTILHGANGVGKTTILRMIDAFARADLSYFTLIPFQRFCLRFENEVSAEIAPSIEDRDMYSLTLVDSQVSKSTTVDTSTLRRAQSLAGTVDYLYRNPADPTEWIDERDGEVLSVPDVLLRYGKSHNEPDADIKLPSWFREFANRIAIHLVETRRLDRRAPTIGSPALRWTYRHRSDQHNQPTVIEYGKGLANTLRDAMAAYGRRAQSLDQSFPTKLLSNHERLGDEELRRRILTIDARHAKLTALGVLDQPLLDTFVFETLDETEARVMTQYVKDTEENSRFSIISQLKCRYCSGASTRSSNTRLCAWTATRVS